MAASRKQSERGIMVSLKRKAVSICCALTLATSLVPVSALAEEECEAGSPVAADMHNTEEGWNNCEEEVEVATAETSARMLDSIAVYSLDENLNPALKPGEYANWVDRVDVPEYALDFYARLEEAADNDGDKDYLIADEYYQPGTPSKGDFIQSNGCQFVQVATASFDTGDQRDQWLSEALAYSYAMMAAFDRDHPEVFWLCGQTALMKSSSASSSPEKYHGKVLLLLKGEVTVNGVSKPFDIRQEGFASESSIKEGIVSRESAVEGLLKGVSASDDDEAKVRHFNTVLTRNNEYNTNLSAAQDGGYPDAWECLSALEGREGERGPVCEGYARAFKVLCDRSNIPCVLVDGTARSATSVGPHMWNYVEVDGAWYGADVTWNDPGGGKAGKVSGFETDKWLLVGAETQPAYGRFIDSHPVSNTVFTNRTAFTNGPTLSASAYVKKPGTSGPSTETTPDPVDPEQPKEPVDPETPTDPEVPSEPETPEKPETPSMPAQPTVPSNPSTGSTTAPTVKPSTPAPPSSGSSTMTKPAPAPAPAPSKPATSPSTPAKPTARPAAKAPTFKKTKILKLKSSKKKTLAVTWKKATKSPVKYQVQYSTDKKFKKGVKTATIKVTKKLSHKSSLSTTVKKLKSKKTYYVRVRAKYSIAGKTYNGPWTATKKVKVK